MSLGNRNFDEITERDLADLINVGVSEGILIEYKRDPYGSSDADVKEFLKDVSSFANTLGGDLVIGIEEKGGVASRIVPVTSVNPDKELQRLESLCRDGIDPRIVGLRIKAIPINAGGFVVVVRVPRSWNPPHRVSARNTNRFYARNSAGAYEVGVEELRVLFTAATAIRDRVRAFRAERLARLSVNEGAVLLAPERSRLVLHLVPFSAFSAHTPIDLRQAYELRQLLHPIGQQSYDTRVNFDGFATVRGGDNCHGYTQIFRNGIIEATYAGVVVERDGQQYIPSAAFDQRVLEVMPKYMQVLQGLGISPPIVVMLSLQGVGGAFLAIRNDWGDPPQLFARDVLELPEVTIESYAADGNYQRHMRPAFDALWNAAGFFASQYFDDQGRWVGPAR